jgi:hypothetical protein
MIVATESRGGRRAKVVAVALVGLAGLGCGADSTKSAITAGPSTGLAVIASDFTSTAISLVAADGTLAKDDCIDSGTQAGGQLSLTLSGDVTLPSQRQQGGELWLIDRGNAALTVVEPTTCAVQAQISVATGFKSNPHDVAVISPSKVYVTRLEKNVAPPDPMSTGDDVVIVDRTSGALTGRIDLSGYAVAVAGATIQARPDRMVIADGKVYVTLGSQDAKFLAAGEGRVVVIDPGTDSVVGQIELPGLKGCSALTYLAATGTLYVACGGSFADADQSAGSGIAAIDLKASPPVVSHVTKASAFGMRPLNFSWVGVVSGTWAFASTLGSFPDAANNVAGSNDAAFAFNPSADGGTPITSVPLEAGAFDIGRGVISGTTLLVPDAAAAKPRVHVFDASGGSGAPTETAAFDPEPAKGLPPREIAWY